MSLLERNLFRLVQAALAAVATYYVVTIASLLTSSEAEARLSVSDASGLDSAARAARHLGPSHYAVIAARDVFNPPKPPEPKIVEAPVSLPPLRATLLGVAPGEDKAFAVVEDPSTHEQRLLSIGSVLQDRELVEIGRNRVTFRSASGRETSLALPVPPAEIQGKLHEPKIDDGTPRHAESVLWQVAALSALEAPRTSRPAAKFLPDFEDGTLRGVRISAIIPNSAYDRFGFKNEDLVRSIDDESFENPLVARRTLQRLPERSSGVVAIIRRDEPLSLDLSSPPPSGTSSGMLGDEDGPVSVWDWKKESRERARGSKPRLRPLPHREQQIVVTSTSDIRGMDGLPNIPISTPSEWDETDLVPIPTQRVSELPAPTDLFQVAEQQSEPLPQIKVTDMRLVHRGLLDLQPDDG